MWEWGNKYLGKVNIETKKEKKVHQYNKLDLVN